MACEVLYKSNPWFKLKLKIEKDLFLIPWGHGDHHFLVQTIGQIPDLWDEGYYNLQLYTAGYTFFSKRWKV